MGREGLQWQFGQTWTCLAHAFLGSFAVFFPHFLNCSLLSFFLGLSFPHFFPSSHLKYALSFFCRFALFSCVHACQLSRPHRDILILCFRGMSTVYLALPSIRDSIPFYIPFTPTAIGTSWHHPNGHRHGHRRHGQGADIAELEAQLPELRRQLSQCQEELDMAMCQGRDMANTTRTNM